jgi:phospholipid/cholesterol/gamma-HCH transport system permease protein
VAADAGNRLAWQRDEALWTLTLPDAGPGQRGEAITLPSELAPGMRVVVGGTVLQAWDAALAAWLFELAEGLRQRGAALDTDSLPVGLQAVLALAQPVALSPDVPALAPALAEPAVAPLPRARRVRAPSQAAITIGFFGEVLLALGRWLRGRSAMRGADVLQQIDLTGPRSLPIVLLSCALIGLMLAYMAGAQLGRIGAQNYLADVVTVGMVRELAGMMTGIILAGRVGSAFAAQLATMKAGEEIDALRVLGVDPIGHLVLPRLLALMAVAPVLIGFGAMAGVLAGWPAAVGAYGVTSAEYFNQCLRALSITHLWIGLFKGMLYVALVALAGCREGLQAGRSAQAVGAATTAAVVKGLVWIVAAACATTVIFTNLGY